jgi:type I restriction enzyme S subunit
MIRGLKPYPEYKNSGVPWLGEVPAHWNVQRAKFFMHEVDERSLTGDEELLSVSHKTGVTPRREKNVTMFLAESNVGYKLCRPGDVVVNTMWAWMAAIGVARQIGIVSPSYGVYRPQPTRKFVSAFLDELLRTPLYRAEYVIRSTGITSSRLRLYPDEFLQIPILCPEVDEQSAITRFLGHVDVRIRSYIRAKQNLIKLLEEQKQTMIHRAVTRGLDPDVRLKPSGVQWLGAVPDHWEVTKLYRITDPRRPIMYGIVLPGPHVNEGVFIVKGGNCESGRLKPEFLSRTTFDIESKHARSRLRGGDIVYAIRGSIGAAELVPDMLTGANLTQDAARIAPGPGIVSKWLLHFVRSRAFFSKLDAGAVGATIRGINIRDLKRADIVVPPPDEQLTIAKCLDVEVERFRLASERARSEISLLLEYRTRLITDVVTGKLDVREAASRLPDDLGEAVIFDDEPLDDADLDAIPEEAEA